ncbi:hypothetical protein [Pedobacter sp. GR22-10]|uniref:hypothetical protein n=1 Tax=Pedobacter TaxID=84567 RepID=UPI002246A235|nr:hypothetical protein [Pedobacter sp. GR22-10]MCX2429596.1 hypothetical protein [Pedobacter sp. GR22-10]
MKKSLYFAILLPFISMGFNVKNKPVNTVINHKDCNATTKKNENFSILNRIPTNEAIGPYYLGATICVSNNGGYKLVMQTDHNLVLYNNYSNSALWASNTQGMSGILRADFRYDGELYLAGGYTYWQANVRMSAPYLTFKWVLQDDGNLCRYTYDSNGVAHPEVASTDTQGGRRSPHQGKILYHG